MLLRGIATLLLLAPTVIAATPNVILCMADDLGWGDTGYNGNSIVKTPNLDAMARQGVRFDRWYAGAPVCSPTRGSCLTGRHPFRYGVKTANSGHMLPSEETLAELLKANGYWTGHFGKWHLGTLTTELRDSNRGRPGDTSHFSPPWKNGFDVCFSTEAKVPTFDPMRRPRTTTSLRYGWLPVSAQDAVPYGTHYFDQSGQPVTRGLDGDDSRVIMDRAIPFIREAVGSANPFFCVIWFHAPHLPVVAGPRHASMYASLDWKQQMYYGCITALDEQMGRLRAELERLEVADNTMLWFASDNGPENGTAGSSGPLRARKRSLYEGGVRVPGILVWPEEIKKPTVVSVPCFTSDYLPTIVDVTGVERTSESQLDGMSLMPLLRGGFARRTSPIFFSHGGQQAAIGPRFKIYRKTVEQPWELYDIEHDPAESRNLATTHRDVVKRMSSSFEAWQASL